MGWFKKKDVVDLTRLQKQGILEKSEVQQQQNSNIVDLSSPSLNESDSNPLAGFFGNIDSSPSASTDTTNKSESTYGSYTSRLRAARNANTTEINALKNKLEDTEYKLERALEKLNIIEARLEEFERRIG